MIVNFVYNNQKYPIDLKLLNKETDYFINNYKQEGKQNIEIQVLNEFENNDEFSTDIISTFLNYFKTGKIKLTPSNIYCLNSLSIKYEIINIQRKTTIYMKNNYKELIDNILNKYEENENTQRYQTNKMKEEEEKLLSLHLIEYIEDYRLQLIPIHNLYHIIELYSKKKLKRKSNQKQNQTESPKEKEKIRMKSKFNEIHDNDKDDIEENNQNENSDEIELNQNKKSNPVNIDDDDEDDKSEEEESKQIKKLKTIKIKPKKKNI